MAAGASRDNTDSDLRHCLVELTCHLETARAEVLEQSQTNAELVRRITELEAAGASVRESRRAALNLMEDAIRSNQVAATLNAELKHEMMERERAEAALRASEDRLRTLSDAVPQIIWANEADGRGLYFNRRWFEYTGLALEESIGPGWQAVVHPDDAAESKQYWAEALAAGEPFDAEYRLRRADGEYRWFIGRNVPLRDADDRVTSWFGTATDIQELKEAQAAESEREKQFRRAIEDAPIPVIMHADDGEVLQVSRAWIESTGYAAEDLTHLDAWLALAHGSGAGEMRERMRQVFVGTGAPDQIEFEIVTKSGERRHWVFSASSPGSLRDGRRYAVGMAIDLTDRKRTEKALAASQERLRLIVEGAIEHAIISMDLERRITSWNTGAERILGFLRDEIVGGSADLIFTAEDRDAGTPTREAELALARGRAADERWHLRKDGRRFWGSGVMLPIHERPDGPATGLIKILRNETERRAAQQALETSRQELMVALRDTERARADAESAMRAKDDFLAALSHELRTPLNPVLLLASEAAVTPHLPDEIRQSFETIRNNVQLEARLIDDLLDLTRISRGKLPLECRPVEVHAALRETAAIVAPEAVQKDIELTQHFSARHAILHADPVRLQQVFWNLLRNAVKFTPDGGRIEVQTHNTDDGKRLLVTVTDNGIGMTAAEIGRIFSAFVQGDHADNPKAAHRYGGLGLGLAISSMLVELHGGSIRAISGGRGLGSSFEVSLPIVTTTPAPAPLDAPAFGRGLSPAALEWLKGERILLVEDHRPTRAALVALLQRRHLAVTSAASLAEARQRAADSGVTLLLSDIGLPDGSGYDLMREFKHRFGARGIALTGYGAETDVAESERSGFTTHLTKPISAQALDRALAIVAVQPAHPIENKGAAPS